MIPKFRAWEESAEEGLQMWSWKEMCEVDLGQFFNNPKYELMQSTGLKDKNGVEIFEGDIVEYFHTPAVIQKVKGGFAIVNTGDYEFMTNLKGHIRILGNIYENPDLVEIIY